MTSKSYAVILEGLDRFLARCEILGLGDRARESRFSRYRGILEELVEVVRLSREGQLTAERQATLSQHRGEYLAALFDGDQISDIAPYLEDFESALLKRKLRDILSGPPLLRDEDPNTNQSRNILFELLLAARLRRAGLNPKIGERPDVTCILGGEAVGFECKRLFSEGQLLGRVAQAASMLRQIAAEVPEAPKQGVVVISVAKLFSAAHVPLRMADQGPIRAFLDEWLGQRAGATKDGRNGWEQWIRAGSVVGILFHVTGIFENVTVGRFDFGEQWLGAYYRESRGFLELGEKLRATAH